MPTSDNVVEIFATSKEYGAEPLNFTVREIAREWKLSVDTVQDLFTNEPDVFVAPRNNRTKPKKALLRQPKRTLRIPACVKERVWRRFTNKRAA